MVPADRALETSADLGIPVVLAQLCRLVHPAVAVAQIGGLRIPEMNAQTLRRAGDSSKKISGELHFYGRIGVY